MFYLSVKSTGADKEEDFNLGVNIQGLFLCFAPSRTDVNNLSSKMLKKKASFMNVKDLTETKTKSKTSEETTSGSSTGTDTGDDTGGENGGDIGSGGFETGN